MADDVVILRFYAELNDLLPDGLEREVPVDLSECATVSDAIAMLGVPLKEVDLILVNGASVDPHYRLRKGDRVSLFPIFETFDISPLVRIREKPLLYYSTNKNQ